MLSTLFTALGLAVSCSTPLIESPQRAFTGNNVNFSYYIKHADDNLPYFTEPLFNHDVEINFNELTGRDLSTTNNDFFVCNINEYTDFYGTFEGVDDFTISYIGETSAIYIYVKYYDVSYNLRILMGDTIQDITDTSSSSMASTYVEYLACAFPYMINISNEQKQLFDVVFGREGNDNFFFYTGWFSVNNSFNYRGADWRTHLISNITYNNDLYGRVDFECINNTLDIGFYYGTNTGNYTPTQKHIYFNSVLISEIDYSRLENVGSFNFIPSSQEYTLSDLFFDIGDTPVVFITGLFSFELFGINFAYAFMSLLTLICIVFIIKKVI